MPTQSSAQTTWLDFVFNNIENTPTGASTNPKIFDLNKNLNMNLI